MTTAEAVLLIGGYCFPTSRLDVWLMSVPAMPVLGDLVSYTVAPISCALLIPTAAQFQADYSTMQDQVQIFHGLEDQVIEHKQARDLHQALPRSDLHLIPNAGHMVTHAGPAAMMEAINSTINS